MTEARSFVSREYARALVTCPMPCGTGACGACAVKTIHGWKMACVDGPFFSLTELDT
ncbi:MAG: 2Fe-2S iron-sulfur cluster-binding protein [Chloroflexota bacterium]